MDLRFSDTEEQFRAEFRGWLDDNLPQEWRRRDFWTSRDAEEGFRLRREWEKRKAEAGYAGISWPKEYGGYGGTPGMKAIYDEEMRRANAPQTVNTLGLTFLAPTVMAIGSEEQKREIIKPLLHTDVIWCQGFSEPGAGSDLAALTTRGVRDGDHFVVNGQKVWTTNALRADRMFAMVRTDPDPSSTGGSPHRGLTMLLVDMHAPGVEARPLVQMTGNAEFGEVFLTDVRVPVEANLGGLGNGWQTAMLLLSFERGSSAIGQYTEFRKGLQEVVELARAGEKDGRCAADDPVVRQRIAQQVIELECLRLHSLHVLTSVEQGRDLGFESSMTKLQWSETYQDVFEVYADVLGPDFSLLQPRSDRDLTGLTEEALWSRSVTIWGGSSQVQRNIVAERVLGLPR